MLRFLAFAVIAALTLSSTAAFARGKGSAKKRVVVHHKSPRRH